jgi:hypothetical protein
LWAISQFDDSTHSFIERRATHVNEMIAGKLKMKSTTTIEACKEASPKILQLWKDRHPAYQNFSSHYMASQRRMLFLADVNPSDRFEAFETICFKRNLAPTTAETYWSTWLGIQKALVIKPSDADHRITKILKARSMASMSFESSSRIERATWYVPGSLAWRPG